MNRKEQLERFTQDVDNIIRHLSPTESEHWTEEYRREMEIARALAVVDFSGESRVRQTLKRELLNTHLEQKGHLLNAPLFQRLFARLSILILVALLALTVSPLGSSLAQTLVQIFHEWQVGDNTTAVSVDGSFEAVPDENGETIILPAPESTNDQEEFAPGQETGPTQERHITLDPTLSFDQAQEMVKFTLREPTFIPDGYEFQGVVVIRSGQASLEYISRSESRLIGLLQTAVGGADGQVQMTFTDDMVVEEVKVDGHEALWTQAGDEGLLLWETQGVNYQLTGLSDVGVALRIAESLE